MKRNGWQNTMDNMQHMYGVDSAGPDQTEGLLGRGSLLESVARRGPLATLFDDILLLFGLVRDFWAGEYTRVPSGVVFGAVAVLVYIINPFDVIPDVIPIVGLTDDAALFLWFAGRIHGWLEDYRLWKSPLVMTVRGE